MPNRFQLFLAAMLFPIGPGLAKPAPPHPGMVSAADPRAAAAGAEILREGGSATDAAIAMMLALNVVEPQSSGLGGGGFILAYDAKHRTTDSYNGREKAPDAADMRWFYGTDGKPLPIMQAIPGGRSVGVPGNLRLIALAHHDHGRLPWATLFQPAIRLARDGFAVSPRLNNSLTRYAAHVDAWARGHYFDAENRPLAIGTISRNPEQAALFEKIAALGPDSFYVGPTAQALVGAVNDAARNPSKMTTGDLASYSAEELKPICGVYRGYKVCGMGPPSSGGVAVLQILKQLERFDMTALGKDSPVAWHLLAESERLAYADRNMFLGDPDHVKVPVAGLIDPAYLATRSALISSDRTMVTIAAGMPAGAPRRRAVEPSEVPGTTHMVAVDSAGNVVTETSTIESPFGSGLTVSGIFLNNELTDFDFVPDKDGALVANRVEGGKRPRSSMAPTIVYNRDGTVRIAIGAAGGSTIIAQVAKALVAVLDWKMSAQDAIALPLLYAPGPVGIVEQGTPLEAMVPALRALGENVQIGGLGLKMNAIEQVGGHWVGGADPRSEGVVLSEAGVEQPIVRNGAPAVGTPHE